MTPDLPDHPTDLTPLQRKYLANIRRFVAEPPTPGRLWAKQGPRLVLLTVLFVVPAAAAWALEAWGLMGFAGGLYVGILLRDSAAIRQAVSVWPATAAVIDRDRLDRLVGEADPDRP